MMCTGVTQVTPGHLMLLLLWDGLPANSSPYYIHSRDSLSSFKRHLKTHSINKFDTDVDNVVFILFYLLNHSTMFIFFVYFSSIYTFTVTPVVIILLTYVINLVLIAWRLLVSWFIMNKWIYLTETRLKHTRPYYFNFCHVTLRSCDQPLYHR